MMRFFNSAIYRRFLLALFYVIVAAAAFNGFYAKWRLNDGHAPHSLASMVDGTAYRPYVYRQLVPAVANGIQDDAWVLLEGDGDPLVRAAAGSLGRELRRTRIRPT